MNVKEKTLCLEKKFCQDYQNTIDWDSSPAMETEFLKQTFTYDAMNRPLTIKQPDDSVIAHSYNKAGLLETLKAQIRGATTWTDFITNINYNEKGQRTEIYYDNGSKTSYTYGEETFRLTRLLTTRDTGSDILQDINYTYNPEGNITEIEDDAQQTFYYSNSVIDPKGKYYYDALYRLTKATGRELTSLSMPTDTDFVNNLAVPNTASNAMQNYIQHYVYDELGNIEQMASQGNWTRDYFYNTGVNTLKGHTSGTTEYTYDAHGNTLSMPHLTSMAWDYKDQLDEVDLGGGGTLYNIYDAGGQRVRKVVVKTGGIVEQRVYFSGWEIYRKSISGTIDFERCYLRISDDRKAIAEVETKTIENGNAISSPTSNIRFQYDNHLGSACLELDTNAAIISYEEYHPFGTTSYRSGRTQIEVSLKRYKYVGKERDEETGLYYYGARYYAGWICRFVSVDPLAKEQPNWNPYHMVENNPIIKTDLDGNKSKIVIEKNEKGGGKIEVSSKIYIDPSNMPKSITEEKLNLFIDVMNDRMEAVLGETGTYVDKQNNKWTIDLKVEFVLGKPAEREIGANVLNVGGSENYYASSGKINIPEQKVKGVIKGKSESISTVTEEAIHSLGFTDRYYFVSQSDNYGGFEPFGFLAEPEWENDILLGPLTPKDAKFDEKHFDDFGKFLEMYGLENVEKGTKKVVPLPISIDSRKLINGKLGTKDSPLDYHRDLNQDQQKKVVRLHN